MKACGVCLHPNRESIDNAMVVSRPLRTIAGQFGISKSALSRHRGHIAAAIVKAKESAEAAQAETLLERLESLIADCKSIALKASRARQWTSAVSALREVRGCVELLGKLSGELQQAPNVNIGFRIGAGTASHLSLGELSDEQLAEKRCRLLQSVRRESSIEGLRQEIRDLEQVIRDKEAQEARFGSVITLPTPVLEAESNISPLVETQGQPEIQVSVDRGDGTGAHYVR